MAREGGVDATCETRTDDDSGEPSKDGPDIAIRVVRDRLERRRGERHLHLAVMRFRESSCMVPMNGTSRSLPTPIRGLREVLHEEALPTNVCVRTHWKPEDV